MIINLEEAQSIMDAFDTVYDEYILDKKAITLAKKIVNHFPEIRTLHTQLMEAIVANESRPRHVRDSMTIYKYVLPIIDSICISMPEKAEILTVQIQSETICLWAKCNPNGPYETRKFCIIGTGNPMPDNNLKYIGTVQMADGRLVWHVFEDLGAKV